jgi:hypothetical protein
MNEPAGISSGVQVIRFQRAPSPGKLADLLAGRPCDPLAYRRVFPGRWTAFLRGHFLSPLHAAVFFDVDERTARHWWEGSSAPQAWVISFAIASIPDARAFLAEAA